MTKKKQITEKEQKRIEQSVGSLRPIEYEKIGRMMEMIVATGYSNRLRLFTVSLIRGLGSGFGVVLGGTILVASLLYILNFFEEVPLVGDLAAKLMRALPNK
ncbi:hypothetical protein KBC31_04115 [Candidatus Saccharibacteria bacterium]|nr:hypothetical protein [Candidatus Saccharibacteria bacterium]